MGRLTVRCGNGEAEPIGDALSYQMIDKLCAYEDAEEQGLLVRLPKVVYEAVITPGFYGVIEWEVISVSYDLEKKQIYRVAVKRNISDKVLYDEKLGKNVCLTYEEAEAAIKEG